MKKLTITLILLTLVSASNVFAKSLDEMKTTLDTQLQKIQASYNASQTKTIDGYKTALQLAIKDSTKKGDLDAVLALKKELARLETEKTVPKKTPQGSHEYIIKFQEAYRIVVSQAARKKTSSSVSMHKKYGAVLEKMKKTLTKAGKIEEALEVNKEIARVETEIKVMIAMLSQKTKPKPVEKPTSTPRKPTRIASRTPSRTLSRTPTRTVRRSVARSYKRRELPDVLKKGLILYYDFEKPGDTIPDSSGNGNHGRSNGGTFGPSYGRNGSGASFRQSKPGLEGNEYVDMPDDIGAELSGDKDFTVAYWVKRRSFPNSEDNRKKGQTDVTFRNGTCIIFMTDRSSKFLDFAFTKDRNNSDTVRGPTELGQWEFWTGTRSVDGQMILYKNGMEVDSKSITIPRALNPNEANRIGWKSSNPTRSQYHPDHCIDEVMIYSRVLTASEVRALYSAMR